MYLLAAFRMERIGSASITWSGTTVTVSTGHYCHVDLTSVLTTCTSFASGLQAALIAAGFANASVSYDTADHTYLLSNGGGSFTIAFPGTTAGTNMKQVLGFSAGATATSHTSDVRPYYTIVTAHDGRSRYTGLRREQSTIRKVADDGWSYALGPTTVPMGGQWEHWHEPLAAVYDYAAEASAPWTWQALWDHAGGWQEPVFVHLPTTDPEGDGVWLLRRPDFDDSTHERQFPDGDFAWKIRIDATRLGDQSATATDLWAFDYASGTFSRASEGSYLTAAPGTGSSAFLAWASSGTRRYEDRGDGAGSLLLVEGSRTNQLLRSQEIDSGSWVDAGTVTTTAGQVSPDTGTTAERLQCASGTNIRYQSLTPGSGWRAFSAWVRAQTGTVDHSIYLFDGVTATYTAQAAISTTYTRLASAVNCGSGAGNFATVDGRTGGGISAGARDAYVTLVQVEAGRYASSAIRTTSATATRSADSLTYTSGNYDELVLTERGGFSQVSPIFGSADLTSGDARWLLSIGGSNNGIRIYHDGTDVRVEALAGGVVKARSAALTFSKHGLLGAVRWDPSAGIVYVNGVAGTTGAAWSWPASDIRVGGVVSGSDEADCRLGTLGWW